MNTRRHGLSIGLERSGEVFFLTFKPVGKLTHEDYKVINPMIDQALKGIKAPHILALVDATEFDGWELRAAWDDFKLGLKHGNSIDKLAIYGDRKWQHKMAHIADWFMCGNARFFDEAEAAISWLKS